MNRIPKDKSPMKSISHTGLVPRSLGQPGIPLEISLSIHSGFTSRLTPRNQDHI